MFAQAREKVTPKDIEILSQRWFDEAVNVINAPELI